MESLSDLVHQILHTFSVFSYSGAFRIVCLVVGILMIAAAPLAVWKALQARRQGLIYSSRFAWIQAVFMLSLGAMELTHVFQSGTIHTYGLFADLVVVIAAIFYLANLPKVYHEGVEYQAAQRAKAAERAVPPADTWPPAPPAKQPSLVDLPGFGE